MTDDTRLPPWFGILREDINNIQKNLNARIDKLVSSETFNQERNRVNDKLEELAKDIKDTQNSLNLEVQARVATEQKRLQQEQVARTEHAKEANSRRWMIFGIVASPLATLTVTWVFTSVIEKLGGP